MICPNCKTELADGVKFCGNCGTAITEAPVVEETPVVEEVPAQEVPVAETAPVVEETPKKKSKSGLVIGGIAVGATALIAVVLIASILLSTIFGITLFGKKVNNYILYFKDSELFYSSVSKLKPIQVTTELVEEGMSESDIVSVASYFSQYVYVTKNGKTAFYIDKIDNGDISLYYRSLSNTRKEPVKIDSDISGFFVSENGKLVTYKKNNNIYQHNLKDKEKIASDVENWKVSKDGKKVIYTDEDGDLYLKQKGKDKVKIDSEITDIHFIDESYKTIWYSKEDALYKRVIGKDRVKIADEVTNVINVYESGEIFYTKEADGGSSASDFISDSMKSKDKATLAAGYPEYPDYPSWYDDDAARDRYYEERDEYYEKCDEYDEAEYREEIRDYLDEELEIEFSELYYYNGKKSTQISDKYVDWYDYAIERPVLIYNSCDMSSFEKIDIMDIDSVYDLEDDIMNQLEENAAYEVAIKGKSFAFSDDEIYSFDMNDAGSVIYYLSDYDEEDSVGDLYKVELSKTKLGKAKRVDSDVFSSYSYFRDNKNYTYFKDVDDEHGELYLNGKKVDTDVYVSSVSYSEQSKKLAYFVDYDEDDRVGTLKYSKKGGKAVKVSDDVYKWYFTPKGEILYLYDYDTDDHEGELYISKSRKPKKIDEDVMAIIPVYDIDDLYAY